MGIVKVVLLMQLAFLLPTLVSPRHFNCANVCEQAGRDHPDTPSGAEVTLNLQYFQVLDLGEGGLDFVIFENWEKL